MVDVSQSMAIKACLQDGEGYALKSGKAYTECYGGDSEEYDFQDMGSEIDREERDTEGNILSSFRYFGNNQNIIFS